jgi:ADP-heptose:LPS heptosyltransferase
MVAAHVTTLLEVAPWIDKVWGYPRFPKGPKPWQDWDRIGKMRAECFDAVLNLNGSDRSSILTWLSGAPLRLGRCRSFTLKSRFLFTHPVVLPSGGKLVSEQHCELLRAAGITCGPLEYHISLNEGLRDSVVRLLGIPIDSRRKVIHVSPFTTQDHKELPEDVLASFLNFLHGHLREELMVISCANNERERSKLTKLIKLLNFTPHRIFAGTLGLLELVAVMSMSRLHLGGDSGGLHVAVMTKTPTLSWFRRYEGSVEWMPKGDHHRALFGEQNELGIQGIDAESLVFIAKEMLNAVPSV